MRVYDCASPDGEEQLHLRIIERGQAQRRGHVPAPARGAVVAELFGLESEPERLRESASGMHYGVATILGHLERDIAFEYVN
jgi:hypothetical protein